MVIPIQLLSAYFIASDIPDTGILYTYSNFMLSLLTHDYYNQLQKLQVIQNAAARLVTRTKKFESISPILRALHWLPIRSRIAFKILLLTYQCFHEMAPSYLSELLVRYEPGRSLRSLQRDLYVVPPISTNFYGKRSFGHAAPELWNGIPNHIKRAGTIEGFKTSLKSYLFRK